MLAFAGADAPHPRTVRPVREAAILFDAQERLLDIVARGGGKTRRQRIAEAFVSSMLEPGAKLAARSRRTLALHMLKQRPQFVCQMEDRVRSVDVAKLVMGAPDHGAIAAFEVAAKAKQRTPEDLYSQAERAFGRDGLPGRGWLDGPLSQATDYIRTGNPYGASQDRHVRDEGSRPNEPARPDRTSPPNCR